AGADMIMLFPNDLEEVKRAPKDIPGPLVYVTSWGNTVDRPVLNTRELGRLGYRMVVEAQPALFATVMAVEDCYRHLKEDGICNFDNERMRALRQDVEALIDLPKYFDIEAGTVER
ncbi:MAG: hypothetical protein HY329_25135, partial [Chloroflexi bacterium]|nr:hypothetical protein [Chloroflexota bacterium]